MGNWWEHEEEQTSDAEMEQFEARQEKLYRTGKLLVYSIVGVNIFCDILTFFMGSLKLTHFAVHLLLSALLIYGFSWVRYLYIAGGILSVVVVIMAIPGLMSLGPLPVPYVLILALLVLYGIASTVLLLFSKSIKEYMYQRKNG